MKERKLGIDGSSAAFVVLIAICLATMPIAVTISMWTSTELVSHNLVTLATFMRAKIQNEGPGFLYRDGQLQSIWTHDGRMNGGPAAAGNLSLFIIGVTPGYRVQITEEAPNRYTVESIYTGRGILYMAVSPSFESLRGAIEGISYKVTVTVITQ